MRLLAAGWLACLLVAQDPVERKVPPVTVRIEPLFETGYSNKWHTLVLEVTNQTSSDQEYRIRVDLGWSDQAERREKFAPKVRKRIFMYLPAVDWSNRVRIRIEDGSGREVLSEDKELALRSSSGSSGANLLPALMERAPVSLPPGAIVRLLPEELFPDRWIGLAGIEWIYIRDYKLDALLPAQRAALVAWVRRGGYVVLCPGSNRDWLRSDGVQELAPVMLGESREVVELPALEGKFQSFRERTKFALHEIRNGEPVESVAGTAFRFRNGLGRVVVVPFDLERAPFVSWPGSGDFKARLVNLAENPPSDQPSLGRQSDLIFNASTSAVTQHPPFLLLFGLTLLYLVAVGPVNFLVLRRLRMTVRLVFTIPAISAVFLGIVILSGYVLRGTSTITFDVCVLEAGNGNGYALEYHHLAVVAASQRSFDIGFGEHETGRPVEVDLERDSRYYRSNRWQSNSSDHVAYDQTDRWTLRNVEVQQWQARAFVGDATRSIGGGVTFRLGAELEIVNRSPYTIRKGWAFHRDEMMVTFPFGDVPPGETRRFPVPAKMKTPALYYSDEWRAGDTIEKRLIGGWSVQVARMPRYRPFILCALDRLPDETTVDTRRSSASERLCLLQVGGEP